MATLLDLLEKKSTPPEWVVLENVPFMLSLDGGRAIRTLADALETMGFSWAYRTIDARAFGLLASPLPVQILASDKGPGPTPKYSFKREFSKEARIELHRREVGTAMRNIWAFAVFTYSGTLPLGVLAEDLSDHQLFPRIARLAHFQAPR